MCSFSDMSMTTSVEKTDIYPLSAELMSKALAKVGIIIDLKALAKDQ